MISVSEARLGANSLDAAQFLAPGAYFDEDTWVMKLDLTDDQALVLFEWLARLDERDALPCEDPAEEQVLWALHGQLEKLLVAPFRANYRELVTQARERVKADRAAG